jgi:hypothetical protein
VLGTRLAVACSGFDGGGCGSCEGASKGEGMMMRTARQGVARCKFSRGFQRDEATCDDDDDEKAYHKGYSVP